MAVPLTGSVAPGEPHRAAAPRQDACAATWTCLKAPAFAQLVTEQRIPLELISLHACGPAPSGPRESAASGGIIPRRDP
jgi:hypothetical protein